MASATVGVAVGIPVFNDSTTAGAVPPLRVIAEILREQLDLKGNVPQVVAAAGELMGLEFPAGANLVQRARQCHEALNGDGSWGRRPGSSRPRTAPQQAAVAAVAAVSATSAPAGVEVAEGQPLEDTAPPALLKCRGVEFGFQYYNFYGEWQLSPEIPLCNERPHYEHNTMYGGVAHLFHVLDSHYHVPRWVIGPHPGNENGWAFCESDARYPHEIGGEWISWDGVSWHSTATLRFIVPDATQEDDESDYGEEAALESLYVGSDGEAALVERQSDATSSSGGGPNGAAAPPGEPPAPHNQAAPRGARRVAPAPEGSGRALGAPRQASSGARAGSEAKPKSTLCAIM